MVCCASSGRTGLHARGENANSSDSTNGGHDCEKDVGARMTGWASLRLAYQQERDGFNRALRGEACQVPAQPSLASSWPRQSRGAKVRPFKVGKTRLPGQRQPAYADDRGPA